MELAKDFCWEAGNPRWVFHGTPAGGAGVHGCSEAGCSVVLLCFDEHHRTHLRTCLLERSVEALVAGSSVVFKDTELHARSVNLNLVPPRKAASAQSEASPKKEKEDREERGERQEEQRQSREERG